MGAGEMSKLQEPSFGTLGVLESPNMQDLLRHLCEQGYEHHVAIAQGNQVEIVHEAFSKYMNWDCTLF
jgi:hypothetical protein